MAVSLCGTLVERLNTCSSYSLDFFAPQYHRAVLPKCVYLQISRNQVDVKSDCGCCRDCYSWLGTTSSIFYSSKADPKATRLHSRRDLFCLMDLPVDFFRKKKEN